MEVVFLRRRKLGRGSCRELSAKMASDSRVCRSWRTEADRQPEGDDLVVRWGCTANVAINNVLNTARAIHQVNDKAGFRMHIADNNEYAMVIPETWQHEGEVAYPCIVRPAVHSRGRNVWHCSNRTELRQAIDVCGEGWYASEYIEKVSEYRVFVVQGRAVAVAEKTPANRDDIAWNVAQGGRFDNVSWDNWPLQAVRKSIEAFNLSELDFGGVDVMVDAEGKAYVIEINSAPSLTSDYRQECMAKAFDYIVQHGKERIPLPEARGGYRKFIHPCVCDRAIVPDTLQFEEEGDAAFRQAGGMLGAAEPTDEWDGGSVADEPRRTAQVDIPADITNEQIARATLAGFTDAELVTEINRRMSL